MINTFEKATVMDKYKGLETIELLNREGDDWTYRTKTFNTEKEWVLIAAYDENDDLLGYL